MSNIAEELHEQQKDDKFYNHNKPKPMFWKTNTNYYYAKLLWLAKADKDVFFEIVTKKGDIIAADAKFVLDDNSLYRQTPLLKSIGIDPGSKRHDVSEQTAFEAKAYQIGFPFIDLLENPENFVKDEEKLHRSCSRRSRIWNFFCRWNC